MHNPVTLEGVGLWAGPRILFRNFSARPGAGDKIALIGPNGAGKTSLLRLLAGLRAPDEGRRVAAEGTSVVLAPREVGDRARSGGELALDEIYRAFREKADLLLLDEPTNHLEKRHRARLIQAVREYPGTLVAATHDTEFLNACFREFWCLESGRVAIFSGSHDEYLRLREKADRDLEQRRSDLRARQQKLRITMERAERQTARGRKHRLRENDRSIRAHKKEVASRSTGKQTARITVEKHDIERELRETGVKRSVARVNFGGARFRRSGNVIAVYDGACGYDSRTPILRDIRLELRGGERLRVVGPNGHGKSTLLRALRGPREDTGIHRSGAWYTPRSEQIGFLDQDPSRMLVAEWSVFENLRRAASHLSPRDLRRRLNDFLFSKNEQVETPARYLSGGERTRLALAILAAREPELLLLDEITNSVDRETRAHLMEVLRAFQGAVLIVSHDAEFCAEAGITEEYEPT